MATPPATTAPPAPTGQTDPEGSGDPVGTGTGALVGQIGQILTALSRRDQEAADRGADDLRIRHEFLDEFTAVCRREVRPAMEAVLAELGRFGGGGLIEEDSGAGPRVRTPRLTAWMSLHGDIVGAPRADRHLYLQLDAEGEERRVRVSEGDMWLGRGGGRSGAKTTWSVTAITNETVTRELVDIIRRAAA